SLFGFSLDPSAHPDRYAMLCMALVAAAGLMVLNIRRGVSGRRFLAVRANERGAASVGISGAGAKLGAFALSAALAGLAGALTTFRFRIADFSDYGVFKSILALTFTIVGGVGFVAGAVFAGAASAGGVLAEFMDEELGFHSISSWLPILSALFVLDV